MAFLVTVLAVWVCQYRPAFLCPAGCGCCEPVHRSASRLLFPGGLYARLVTLQLFLRLNDSHKTCQLSCSEFPESPALTC